MISWVDISKGPELPYKGEPFQMPLNLKLVENLLFSQDGLSAPWILKEKDCPAHHGNMLPLLSAIAMHCLQLNSALMLVLLVPCCQEATDEVLWGWSGAHQGCTTLPQTKYRATPHGKYAKKTMNKMPQFWSALCVYTVHVHTEWVSEHAPPYA